MSTKKENIMKLTRRHFFTVIFLIFAVPFSIIANIVRSGADGITQPDAARGTVAGSYLLDGFDTVNLYNRSVNFKLPLATLQGRGAVSANYSITIDRSWGGEYNESEFFSWYTVFDRVPGQEIDPATGAATNFDPAIPRLVLERTMAPRYPGGVVCSEGRHLSYVVTRFKFVMPDGSEHIFHDVAKNGAAYYIDDICSPPPANNRGRVFVTSDATAATLILDNDLIEDFRYSTNNGGAVVILRDGTRCRFNGVGGVFGLSWIQDSNGNRVTYQVGAIVDSNGRKIEFISGTGTPAIGFTVRTKGFNGTNRDVKVYNMPLREALRQGSTLKTYPELFPETTTDVYGSMLYDPVVVSRVELPNGKSYFFYYNSYGELARVILPTGGGYDYEYPRPPDGGFNVHTLIAERPLSRRTVYNALDATTDPDNPPAANVERIELYSREDVYDKRVITVETRDGNNVLLAQSKHYFFGDAGFVCSEPLIYPKWWMGKEYKTEYFQVSGGVAGPALKTIEHVWSPTPGAPGCSTDNTVIPWPNPKIIETRTTIDGNLVSKQTFDYDLYHNMTNVYEYDFGVGAPGPLIRRTHTSYLTTNGYQGYVDYAADLNIHIRNLPIQKIVYDASGNVKSQTDFIYDNYSGLQLVDCPGIVQHDSAFHTGYGARGNLTEEIHYNPGGSPPEVHLQNQYDIAGNMVKKVDGRGYPTDFYFNDSYGAPDDETISNAGAPELAGGFSYAFPTKVTNALGHTTYTQYDYYLGKPVNLQDANDVVSSIAYNDVLDRPTQSIQARYKVGVGIPADRRQSTTVYDDTNHVVATTSDLNMFNDNALAGKSYYDRLGRTRRGAAREGATWLITDTQLDALGRVSQVSNPYRAADPDTASPPSGAFAEWTTTVYDALGRVTSITTPDGAHVDTAYSGNQVTVTDQAGKKRRGVTDALGRLINVTEAPGELNYVTYYSYDALDNLRLVTQGSQTRAFDYDSLSRLTSVSNPESGPVTYAYDPNGNLINKTDPRGVITTITYDKLNRARSKVYAGTTPEGTAAANATPQANYFYDDYTGMPSGAPAWPGTPSKGRLTGVTYGPGSEGTYYKYNAAGRIVTNHQRQGTSNYVTTYFYNLAGAVTREDRGNPARRRNWMNYDAAGRLISMQTGIFNANGFEPHDLVLDISYTPFGGLQSETYGNGLIHSMAYNERLQPAEIRLGRLDNLESVFRIGYIYGTAYNVNGQDPEITLAHNNGNVARIKYFISGALQYSQTFQYDPVNRLRYAVEHNNGLYNDADRAWYQTFAYDPYGNRGVDVDNTSDNVEPPNGALKLADFSGTNNRIIRSEYNYDASGNLIAEPLKNFTYDAEGRIVTASVAGGASSQYFYDGTGHRVKKIVGGVATRFEYGAGGELIAERNESTGAVTKDYFYKGEELLATTKAGISGEYEYATADHLGSPRAWTDDQGNLIAGGRHDYLPFGVELFAGYGVRTTGQGYAASGQQDGQRKQFGSHERDAETALDYFGARYYASIQGRFTSVDPLLRSGKPIEPQSWNRYSYVDNNPLIYVDTDGQIKRNFFGRIVFKKEGAPGYTGHRGAPNRLFKVQKGYVIADDGTRIDAIRGLDKSAPILTNSDGSRYLGPEGNDKRFKCDCHGLTFADGKYWINDNQVDKLLKGDNYRRTDTPKVGDIAVYRNAAGEVEHSVTVTNTDSDGNVTEVSGLGGIEPRAHSDSPTPGPGGAWDNPTSTVEYYTKDGDKRSDKRRKKDAEKVKKYDKEY
jgi:RHS repeat-associated protein